MKALLGPLLAAAAVVTVAGYASSSISVDSKSSPGVDFSRYKSYSRLDMTEVKNPVVKARLATAVDAQLQAKGLVRKDEGGDLTVAIHPRLTKEYSSSANDNAWDYGWGTWASIGDLSGGSSTSTRLAGVPIGTVIVDLVDASTKQLVWRGAAASPLDSEDSAEKRKEILDEAMRKLFARFPPRRK